METKSNPDVLVVYQNGFDRAIHDFEKFAREVFDSSNENEKEKLHKKLEQFTTFKEYYVKKFLLQKNEVKRAKTAETCFQKTKPKSFKII